MKKRIVKRIVNVIENRELPLEKMEFIFVGENNAMGRFKGYGFLENYGTWNGYKVETEEVEEN